MKPTESEIHALGEELFEIGKRLFQIAGRLVDQFTEDQRTCLHDEPLIRESCMPGYSADEAIQIMVRCPKCGAGTSLAGYTRVSDDFLRGSFPRPT